MENDTDYMGLTAKLLVSCSALLIYLEGAFDQHGNPFSDASLPKLSVIAEAEDTIAQAKKALRMDR